MKVERKYGAPWETKERRELIRLRNKYRRDMRANRSLWSEVSRRITELTIQNQRIIWQDHLQKMAKKKDVSVTWNVVKSLNG